MPEKLVRDPNTLVDATALPPEFQNMATYVLPDVGDTFDPSVSGLAGRVGATVGTADKTKHWEKTGTGLTDWNATSGA